MNNILFILLLFVRFIVMGVIYIYIGCVITLIGYLLVNHLLFQVNIAYLFSFPAKSILAGGICCGIGRWLIFMINYYQSVRHGKNSLRIFTNNGYDVEINEISPNIKIPFYKINGELFYNYAPFARDISVMLSGIKKIAKYAEPKNIVINLVDSSVNFEKLVQRLVANFSNKFNKIIIINKPQNIITIKDGNWLSINPQYLLYQCPCCGEHTLNRPGKEETCSVCGWIDDPLQSLDPDYKNGFNKISLNEAIAVNQKNFKKEIK